MELRLSQAPPSRLPHGCLTVTGPHRSPGPQQQLCTGMCAPSWPCRGDSTSCRQVLAFCSVVRQDMPHLASQSRACSQLCPQSREHAEAACHNLNAGGRSGPQPEVSHAGPCVCCTPLHTLSVVPAGVTRRSALTIAACCVLSVHAELVPPSPGGSEHEGPWKILAPHRPVAQGRVCHRCASGRM